MGIEDNDRISIPRTSAIPVCDMINKMLLEHVTPSFDDIQ